MQAASGAGGSGIWAGFAALAGRGAGRGGAAVHRIGAVLPAGERYSLEESEPGVVCGDLDPGGGFGRGAGGGTSGAVASVSDCAAGGAGGGLEERDRPDQKRGVGSRWHAAVLAAAGLVPLCAERFGADS